VRPRPRRITARTLKQAFILFLRSKNCQLIVYCHFIIYNQKGFSNNESRRQRTLIKQAERSFQGRKWLPILLRLSHLPCYFRYLSSLLSSCSFLSSPISSSSSSPSSSTSFPLLTYPYDSHRLLSQCQL
jgi:hypothetical protein